MMAVIKILDMKQLLSVCVLVLLGAVGWPVQAALYAEYHLEETSYNGTAGEVKDTSGNGRHARIVGAASSSASGRAGRGLLIPENTTSAIAVTAHMSELETIATLDLRIDYLKAATPGKAIYCTAECYRLASQIAFTRAVCYHDSPDDPIAHGVATFMRDSNPKPMLAEGAA